MDLTFRLSGSRIQHLVYAPGILHSHPKGCLENPRPTTVTRGQCQIGRASEVVKELANTAGISEAKPINALVIVATGQ